MRISRRKFLQTSTTAAAATLLTNLEQVAAQMPQSNVAGKVPVKILATNWGWEGSWDAFCAKAKGLGYDGFEAWIPLEEKQRNEVLEAAAKHGLEIGFLAGSGARNFEQHWPEYEKGVRLAAAQKPLYVNTHAGRDHFTLEQNLKILSIGLAVAAETGVKVLCETHRSRCAFSANATRELMDKLPNLRLTADLSHWCCVHEGLLGGYEETVGMALERTDHIHARIGHAEGPQVNDPRAPEWAGAVQAHFGWWDKIMEHKAAAGAKHMTFLTEFGPPHYLPALPYTQQPVADQWAINVHMMQLLRERYG